MKVTRMSPFRFRDKTGYGYDSWLCYYNKEGQARFGSIYLGEITRHTNEDFYLVHLANSLEIPKRFNSIAECKAYLEEQKEVSE